MFTDEKWWDIVGPAMYKYVKAGTKAEGKMLNQVFFLIVFSFCFCFVLTCFCIAFVLQVARHKSKKGGVKKRVYFWGGISWWVKTSGVAWTASDNAVIFRHTKNLCVGTLFEDVEDDGTAVVFRVTETRSGGDNSHVYYVSHFDFPDEDPPPAEWEHSSYSYKEVKT